MKKITLILTTLLLVPFWAQAGTYPTTNNPQQSQLAKPKSSNDATSQKPEASNIKNGNGASDDNSSPAAPDMAPSISTDNNPGP